MDDLTAFIAARLDEDEAAAKAALRGPWSITEDTVWGTQIIAADGAPVMPVYVEGVTSVALSTATHIARHDPARALREVAAKRALLSMHAVNSEPERWGDSHPDRAMRGQPTGHASYWCDMCDHDRDYGHVGSRQEGCHTLRAIAAVWSDHPDYRAGWAPGEPS